jgi:sterol desaturase/sphingolipid hydroxylase (fatty acid hydroxylase superfamily)
MQMAIDVRDRIVRNALLSVFLYALPVLLMIGAFAWSGQRPWLEENGPKGLNQWATQNLNIFTTYGWPLFMVILGVIEFSLGLYEKRWKANERKLDIACFVVARFITRPLTAFVGLQALPVLLPTLQNRFQWVPFFWGFFIIAVADDLTQYWYHRLHHEIPWLWRFHRTHHSAPYMGMAMAGRQNLWYTVFFSQTYLTTALVYLGLGASAVVVLAVKQIITTMAHSSVRWDRPLYEHKLLHPVAWVVERLISTPATHHAHHADTNDGIGFYKGNFGNMFFLWDVIFGTGLITRQYPKSYGVSHYEGDEWYAQFLWPMFKSSVPGSELAADGPIVKADDPKEPQLSYEAAKVI